MVVVVEFVAVHHNHIPQVIIKPCLFKQWQLQAILTVFMKDRHIKQFEQGLDRIQHEKKHE